MKGKLLEYGNESRVEFDDIDILDLRVKQHGLMEFQILCRIQNGQGDPDGRYTVELDDGRRGTVLVIINKFQGNSMEITLDGEGVLE